jgi:hypothetical protein
MITNILHTRPEFIGINIEKVNDEFVVCVAFKDKGKWKAKTMGGISGDIGDVTIFDNAVAHGQDLDKETASAIFQKAIKLELEYSCE